MHSALLVDHPDFIPTIARWYFDDSGYKIPGNSFEGTCERIRGKLNRDTPPLHVIALIENRLVGVAQWKRYEMPEYPTNEHWLGSLYVPPDERYNGVGRFLANEVASIAKRNRVSRLYLCTEHLSGGLYAEAGWVPFDRAVSRGDEVLVMVKDLDV